MLTLILSKQKSAVWRILASVVSSISRVRAVFVLMAVGWYTLDEMTLLVPSSRHQPSGICSALLVQDIDHPRYFSLSDIILYTLYWAVALFLHGIFSSSDVHKVRTPEDISILLFTPRHKHCCELRNQPFEIFTPAQHQCQNTPSKSLLPYQCSSEWLKSTSETEQRITSPHLRSVTLSAGHHFFLARKGFPSQRAT